MSIYYNKTIATYRWQISQQVRVMVDVGTYREINEGYTNGILFTHNFAVHNFVVDDIPRARLKVAAEAFFHNLIKEAQRLETSRTHPASAPD